MLYGPVIAVVSIAATNYILDKVFNSKPGQLGYVEYFQGLFKSSGEFGKVMGAIVGILMAGLIAGFVDALLNMVLLKKKFSWKKVASSVVAYGAGISVAYYLVPVFFKGGEDSKYDIINVVAGSAVAFGIYFGMTRLLKTM